MTVVELIRILEVMPPDMDVCISLAPQEPAYEISKVDQIDDFVLIER